MLWPVASLSVRHARHKEAVLMTRRTFGKICAASGASAAVVPISAAALSLGASPRRHDQSTATAQDDDKLASEPSTRESFRCSKRVRRSTPG